MRIGEAAARLGVAEHVLRHWDDVNVVVPDRTPSGHREYSEEHFQRLRVVQACQGVDMSLSEIRKVLHKGGHDRSAAIQRQLRRVRAQQQQLWMAEQFLVHVIDCKHDMVTKCDDCTEFASSPR